MAKILITGGAGFIGHEFAEQLHNLSHEVRILDLVPPKLSHIESMAGSILDVTDVTRAVRGCDYVIHLAAMLGVKRTDTLRMRTLNVNIQGTLNILEACVKDGVDKILFSSSSEVYGEQAKNPISEDNPLNPKSVYAVSKIVCEEYLKAYKMEYGLDYTTVRFFNVYGPNQVAEFVMPRFIKAAMQGIPLSIYGDGRQVRSFCFVSDAVNGAIKALSSKSASGEVFNIGNDREPISMRDLAEKVIAVTKSKSKIKLVAIENSDRKIEREIFERIPDISQARKLLKYAPKVTLEEGIKRVSESGDIPETWFDPVRKPTIVE